MSEKTDPGPAIELLQRAGWTCNNALPDGHNRFLMTTLTGECKCLEFCGRKNPEKSGRIRFGVHYKYFDDVDLMIFWAHGVPVMLLVPTPFLASCFDHKLASINKARWIVRVMFDRNGKSELELDRYPKNLRLRDVTRFAFHCGISNPLPNPAFTKSEQEGYVRYALRKHRSREWRLRKAKLERAMAQNEGKILCEVQGCRFDFVAVYGDLGRGFAHVHHNVALTSHDGPSLTTLDDLTVVCPNCHWMIHRWMRLHPDKICPIDHIIVRD